MVTTAPSRTQKPPSSVAQYEFSYNRNIGKMRFRLDGQEWNVASIVCQRGVESVGVDHEGKWQVRCRLVLGDETFVQEHPQKGPTTVYRNAYVYLPKDIDPHDYEIPTDQMPETHWRLCYNRAGSEADKRPHWRLRDERTNHLYSNDIRDYRGIVNINWMDGGPHVFHDGKVYVDNEGVAHFAP